MTYNRRIKNTIEAFQPFYEMALTANEGMEIQNNVVSFVTLLDRWNERRNSGLVS